MKAITIKIELKNEEDVRTFDDLLRCAQGDLDSKNCAVDIKDDSQRARSLRTMLSEMKQVFLGQVLRIHTKKDDEPEKPQSLSEKLRAFNRRFFGTDGCGF